MSSSVESTEEGSNSISQRLEIARSSIRNGLGNAKDSLDPMDNSFAASNGVKKIESGVDSSLQKGDAMLTSGQQDFQNAMSSMVKQSVSNVDSAMDSFDQSSYDLKKGLYDAKGKLAGEAASTTEDLRARLRTNANTVADQSREFVADLSSKVGEQELSPSDVLKKAMPEFNNSFSSKTKSAGNHQSLQQLQKEISEGKRQIEALRNQIATNNTDATRGKSNQLAPIDNGFDASSNSVANSMTKLQPIPRSNSQKTRTPEMRMPGKVDSNHSLAGSNANFSPGGALSRLQPIEGDPGFATKTKPGSQDGTVYGSLAPSSGTSPTPMKRQSPSTNQFPRTTHGSFSKSQTMGPSGVGQVNFEDSNSFDSGRVARANALEPIGNEIQKVSPIATHVEDGKSLNNANEVELPSAILVGEGSYAPGSVNRLRK